MKAKNSEENKKNSITKLVSNIEKLYGKGSFWNADSKERIDVPKSSSGSLVLDMALGGGYPKGRIIEIYGGESTGKTTLTIHALIEMQKQGGTVGFIDSEHALDLNYAEKLGLDRGRLFISQPDYGEQGLEILDLMVKSGEFSGIVVDSVATLLPKSELEGDMGESQMGKHARLMSQGLRKIVGSISKTNTTVFFINQTRSKIGVVYGSPTTTTGGNALKFYASQRLELARIGQIKDTQGEVIGHKLKIKVVKNKIAPPFKVATVDVIYGMGVSKTHEILHLATEYDIILKSGSWFSYGDTKLGQGQNSAIKLLDDNPELFDEIKEKVIQRINNE